MVYLQNMKYCLVFVCQSGELEVKSLLLASSLKRYLQGDYECVAAIPQPATRWGPLSANTQTLLNKLNIRTVAITNRIDDNYPIGNKVDCLGIETTAPRLIFLDSDILCLRKCHLAHWFSAPFSAKPADLATLTYDLRRWQRIYQLFDLPFPTERLLATVSGELMLPYFNSGVIGIQTGLGFSAVWEDCCRVIDADSAITDKRPWLDQLALPMALMKLNLPHHSLDERLNYPAHLKPLPPSSAFSSPVLCHYHWPSVIRREPGLKQLVNDLVNVYPLLKPMLLAVPEWAPVLQPNICSKPRRRWSSWLNSKLTTVVTTQRSTLTTPFATPEAIITGIPRSGTSYLCRLLHDLPECVVINEPTPIYQPLTQYYYPWPVATYYQELRRDILEGQAIENKMYNGQMIEDTAIIDVRTRYKPTVTRPDFLIATKNTLAYLVRIPQLKRVMPAAPIIACVRHPFDTIASWKTTFPHLQQAQVNEFPVGHPNDPFLSHWQTQRLGEIAATPQVAVKRALLWRYLAECVLLNRNQLILVRYEELVPFPETILRQILPRIPGAPPFVNTGKIIPSTLRHKREVLTTEDKAAILDLCQDSALALGYELNF